MYIYGYENPGKLLYQEITKIPDLEVCCIETNAERIAFKDHSMMIVSILDSNRDLIRYLDSIWNDISKCYLDDFMTINVLKDFLAGNKEIYVYGAGHIGKRLSDSLRRSGYQIDGFIVSDGRKTEQSMEDVTTFELGELRGNKEIGIIVAVIDKYREEIVNLLESRKYRNYIVF